MKEINEYGFSLDFMDDGDFEADKKQFEEILRIIREQRERNVTVDIPWCQVVSPNVAYIYPTLEEIHPIYSESDGYGRVHIWKDGDNYNAGIEIERRYLDMDEQKLPQIRVYDKIPESIQQIIEIIRI